MTFWQENYSFIKEVYDTRYAKMVEWMDNVEMAIQKVCASKVYTSAEFKRERITFMCAFLYFYSCTSFLKYFFTVPVQKFGESRNKKMACGNFGDIDEGKSW